MKLIHKFRFKSLADHVVLAVFLGTMVTIVDFGWLIRDILAHGALTIGYAIVGIGLLLGTVGGIILLLRLISAKVREDMHNYLLIKLKHNKMYCKRTAKRKEDV